MSLARKNILARIQKALQTACPAPFSESETNAENVFHPLPNHEPMVLLEHFGKQFAAVGGKLFFVKNWQEAGNQLHTLSNTQGWEHLQCWEPALQEWLSEQRVSYESDPTTLLNAQVGISSCKALIARTGTIVIETAPNKGRGISVVPPVHLVLAKLTDILPDLKDYFDNTINLHNSSMCCLITGASRTADIEKTLVMGAHGPKEIYLICVDNP